MQVFESGGGGRKNAAMQALAAAQLAARKAANASAETSGRNGGPDPRLQPPEKAERTAQFKPGTSTWNTDDPSQVSLPGSVGTLCLAGKTLMLCSAAQCPVTSISPCQAFWWCERHALCILLKTTVQAPPWVRAQMAKDMEAGRWRGQAKPEQAGAEGAKDGKKPVPKPYMSTELREDNMRTTGGRLTGTQHMCCNACSCAAAT